MNDPTPPVHSVIRLEGYDDNSLLRHPIQFVMRGVTRILVPAIVLAACSDEMSSPAVTIRDSLGVTIVENHAPAWAEGEGWTVDGEPVLSIGTIDGSPEYQLFRVRGAVRLADGSVVVNNGGTAEIRVYGLDGQHVRTLGGEGAGPGEFSWIAGIQLIPPDTLLAREGSVSRLTYFLIDGTHLETRNLTSPVGPWRGPDARLPDGRYLEYQSASQPPDPGLGYVSWSTAAVAYAEGEARLDTLLTAPGDESYYVESTRAGRQAIVNMAVHFGRRGLRAVQGGAVALSDGAEYDVRVRRADGALLRIRQAVERRPVADVDVSRLIESSLERVTESRRPQMRRRMEDAPTSSLMPSHSALEIDRLGNLWVETYRVPDDVAPRNWSVFNADGRWLGEVVLLRGLRAGQGDRRVRRGVRARVPDSQGQLSAMCDAKLRIPHLPRRLRSEFGRESCYVVRTSQHNTQVWNRPKDPTLYLPGICRERCVVEPLLCRQTGVAYGDMSNSISSS